MTTPAGKRRRKASFRVPLEDRLADVDIVVDESAPARRKRVASYVQGVKVRNQHPASAARTVASVALLCVMVGCGSDPERRSPPPSSANRLLDAEVAARLRAVAGPARRAYLPRRLDMRRIAKFPWTRMFVYEEAANYETPSVIRADLAKHGVTTAGPGIFATRRPLIVFANGRRVVRVAHSSAIDFQCLAIAKPLRRNDPLIWITRSKGAREKHRYPLVAAPVPFPKPDENPCLDSFGILT